MFIVPAKQNVWLVARGDPMSSFKVWFSRKDAKKRYINETKEENGIS